MENLITVLFILGISLLLIEAFIPGFGIFGAMGLLMLIVSFSLTVTFLDFGVYILIVQIGVIIFLVYLMYKYIKSKQLYGKIVLDETLNFEAKEVGQLEYFLGKEGIAITPLKPFGKGQFGETITYVSSQGEFISKGSKVKIISIENEKIIVTVLEQ
jgi:membrane-bound serine protease (ClpP class)